MNAYHSKKVYDPNWFRYKQYYNAVNNSDFDQPISQGPVRHDGYTRIRDYPSLPISVLPLGFEQPEKPYVADNLWPMKFFDSQRRSGDVYDYYRYMEVPPETSMPRSRANGAEFRRDIQNKWFYRREDSYELHNTVIHPTHLSEMTPERIAADPNQAIYNYYY